MLRRTAILALAAVALCQVCMLAAQLCSVLQSLRSLAYSRTPLESLPRADIDYIFSGTQLGDITAVITGTSLQIRGMALLPAL